MADDYFKPRHATPAERAVLDKALGRSMSEVPDPEIAALRAQLEQAQAERDKLKALAEEAIESIEDWAGYADAYFQNKHDLQGELVRLRAALNG